MSLDFGQYLAKPERVYLEAVLTRKLLVIHSRVLEFLLQATPWSSSCPLLLELALHLFYAV